MGNSLGNQVQKPLRAGLGGGGAGRIGVKAGDGMRARTVIAALSALIGKAALRGFLPCQRDIGGGQQAGKLRLGTGKGLGGPRGGGGDAPERVAARPKSRPSAQVAA